MRGYAMAGYVYITEYSNMGDVSTETPVEPVVRVQKVEVGGSSDPLNNDTRMVVLFATFPCMVHFSAGEPDNDFSWPIASGAEVTRLVRPNTGMTIHLFPEEMML